MTYRFAEFPARALLAFLEDTTTGVNARCAAINANQVDAAVLPTTALGKPWHFPQFQPDRGLYLPMVLIEWAEDEGGEQVIDDAPYRNRYWVSLIMGVDTTAAQLGGQAILKMRGERVLREIFDSTKGAGESRDGNKAGAANGAGRLIGCRLRRVHDGPIVTFTDLDDSRAIVIVGEVETLHEEAQSPTA